jgi:hypothetical protein
MIVRRAKRDEDAPKRSKEGEVEDMVEYVAGENESRERAREKVIHVRGLNFITDEFVAQKAEMMALAREAVRSPMPVHHWFMSWREGEQPTTSQVDRAVEIFLQHMGLSEHQCIYGLHDDTANVHVHLAVNMAHPETGRMVTVNKGFDHEIGLQAAALIEHEQGWQPELRQRYRVNGVGGIERVLGHVDRPRPSNQAEDMETRTGEKSAERIAMERGAPAMRRARSWLELHQKLADHGMRFGKRGSGGVLWVGETPVKPSSAGRDCSWGALEKRLGPYEPAPAEIEQAARAKKPREPEPISQMPRSASWKEYITERTAHYAAKRQAYEEMRALNGKDWSGMVGRHREARRATFAGDWRGRGALLNEARSAMAAQQAVEKVEIKERRARARRLLQERYPRFPDYEEWLRRERGPDVAEQWRYRDRGPEASVQAGSGDQDAGSVVRDLRDFEASRNGWDVEYRRATRVDPAGTLAFVDRGRQVDIFEQHDRATVLAALQLAAEKWGGKLQIKGDERYKQLCVELAVENRWDLVNPELQKALAAGRARQARPTVPPPVGSRDQERTARSTAPAQGASDPGSTTPSSPAAPPAAPAAKEPREASSRPLPVPVPLQPAKERPTPSASELPASPQHLPPVASPASAAVASSPSTPPSPVGTIGEAYARHVEDVRRRHERLDASRVDAVAAVQLRITGYDKAAIEKVLREVAPASRPSEVRDWNQYARRAIAYAYGRAGSWQLEQLAARRHELLALEGRPVPQPEVDRSAAPAPTPSRPEQEGPSEEPARDRSKDRGGGRGE